MRQAGRSTFSNRQAKRGALAVIACAIALSGCASVPRSVSSLSEVQNASEAGEISLVPLTAQSLPAPPHPLTGTFPDALLAEGDFTYDRLGPGDRLYVRIFESGTATVFAGPSGADLGEVTIDESGRLFLPYAGAVNIEGMTIAQARNAIVGRLSKVVLRPQVDLRAVERRSTLVTVQGNVGKSGVFPIDRGRTRLSALLAEVAPNQENPEMLSVTVRRDNMSGQARLADIYRDARLDLALRPGDSIVLNNVVENVTVLGAAGIQGRVKIPERDFSLLDTIGAARGLSDDSADPRAVFLMRPQVSADSPPLVYQLDMRRPDALALATRFIVSDGDAVFISNAPFTQARKVLSAFSQTLGTVRSATTVVP